MLIASRVMGLSSTRRMRLCDTSTADMVLVLVLFLLLRVMYY